MKPIEREIAYKAYSFLHDRCGRPADPQPHQFSPFLTKRLFDQYWFSVPSDRIEALVAAQVEIVEIERDFAKQRNSA